MNIHTACDVNTIFDDRPTRWPAYSDRYNVACTRVSVLGLARRSHNPIYVPNNVPVVRLGHRRWGVAPIWF